MFLTNQKIDRQLQSQQVPNHQAVHHRNLKIMKNRKI